MAEKLGAEKLGLCGSVLQAGKKKLALRRAQAAVSFISTKVR